MFQKFQSFQSFQVFKTELVQNVQAVQPLRSVQIVGLMRSDVPAQLVPGVPIVPDAPNAFYCSVWDFNGAKRLEQLELLEPNSFRTDFVQLSCLIY
jgi:hypothetical protein